MVLINWIDIIKAFSYFGFFILGLISSSTIFIPFPIPIYFPIVFSEKLGLNPIISAFFAALGSSFGETTSYFIGKGITITLLKKEEKKYKKYVKIFEKYGDVLIFLFASLPLPFDTIGIISGFLKYDIKKFLIFTFVGKLVKMLIIVYLGEIALQYIGW